MRFHTFFIFCLFLVVAGCSTDSNPPKKLNLKGNFSESLLSHQEVFELKTKDEFLYAGTDKNLYQKTKQETTWQSLGLSGEVHTFVVLSKQILLASVNFSDRDSLTIARTIDGGKNWSPYLNGFGGNQAMIPNTMDVTKGSQSIIFARTPPITNIARSSNGGKSWTSVLGSWTNPNIGTSIFVKVDPNDVGTIWAGGANAMFLPSLFKSTNGGDSWKGLVVIENVETTVYDVATYPSNPDHVLAGMAGVVPSSKIIRKSTDGGQSWQTVFEGINTRTLAHSARDPRVVYASGINQTGTLFFVASADFGDSWQTVDMPGSPTGIRVNDMVSVMQDGHEVLYLGTNNGVYTYSFEK